MSCMICLTISLFCFGTSQSFSLSALTSAPTFNLLVNELQNKTDHRNSYVISTYSESFNQSQLNETTSFESAPPTPPDGFWSVTDGNVTCIRAHLKIRFKINTENETKYLILPPNADSSNSSCKTSDNDQILTLHIDKVFEIAFTFGRSLENSYELKNITLTLFSPEGTSHFYHDIKIFSVKNHYSYSCQSLMTVSMENVSMESFGMQFEAFGGSEKTFSAAEICPDDDKMSKIVTILIITVISVLFVTMLIACFVQRRKTLRGCDSIKLIRNKNPGVIPKQNMPQHEVSYQKGP